ncbi:AMP-binding protein [Mycobacterium sp. URHB0021]
MDAIQLPNWWRALVLFQAVARLGAVFAPCMTTIRPRELERMLRRVDANVCITVDRWSDFEHADALRDMASRLAKLRHRVVFGQAGQGDIEFAPFFEGTPWEQRHPVALDDAKEDPDAVSVVLFTSGTSGEPKALLHTQNTIGYQRREPFAQDLFPGDFGVPVGRALFGVPVDRAQQ